MNTTDENGLLPSSSSTPFTISGHGGSFFTVHPIQAVSPVSASYHLQPAFVPPNHRHPLAYTPDIYSFDAVVCVGGQNQQKPVLVPDIRSSVQVVQMGADRNPKMDAAKDWFTERNQLGNVNNNQVSSKDDPAPILSQMHRKMNFPSVSDVDCNKRQEGGNQISRDVRTERIQIERMGNCQNHCSIHNPSYLQRETNFTSSTNGKASMNSEKSQVGTGRNGCPLHASMLRQIPMNMNSNLAPVNQNHNGSGGNAKSFQMGKNQSENHPQMRYSTIGQLSLNVNNPSKAPPVEPVTLKANNSLLATVKTEYGSEISAEAKGGGGNTVGLVTVKTEYGSESTYGPKEGKWNSTGLVTVKKEYGSESTAGAEEGKGNSLGLVIVKKEFGSEITAGAKEGKGNSVGLVTVKQEYGSEITAGANEGRWNSVRLAEAANLNVNATTNAENRGGMITLANVGGHAAIMSESTPNSSEIAAAVTVGKSNAEEVLESASLKLKNLFNLTVSKTDHENPWQVTPEAKMQRGTAPGQNIYSNNTQVPNVDQLRSALATSLSRFKDLTVLGTGAILEARGNMLAETPTNRKKRKHVMKETTIIRATEENASSNGDDRERVRKALMTFDALRRNLMSEDELCKEAGGGTRRPDLKAGTLMMDKGQWINRGRRFIGSVPGVHVGDHFYFRMELCVIGLHGPSQAGIDFITAKNNQWNEPVAICIISSGGYEDDDDGGDVLIYTGQGGNNYIPDKKQQSVDQKLERGNLALERSMHYGVEIRVIRGVKDSRSPSGKIYIYDGLYKIEQSWLEKGRSGCGVFKYKLQRIPGQPELGSAILKNTRYWKAQPLTRLGLLHSDLSLSREKLPIFLANNVDNEKGPPHFEYTSRPLRYRNSELQLGSSEGCACVGWCDPINCFCAQRNGKQVPYSSNGILTKGKPLIYECNELCGCPLSCRNRVTQRGSNVTLEVFRTIDKRWGVRSWDPIAAGTFISEYTGQVVTVEEQATIRDSDSEYVLNPKQAKKITEWGIVSDILWEQQQQQDGSSQAFPPLNFVIDATKFGNVSRFIKHSSCPNVLMQFVLHDHLDIRFPHIMLFARENIPPLTELTFDYGSVPSSYSEETAETRVLAKLETLSEHNQNAMEYKYVN